jgi:hypothetical protein
MRYLVAAAAVLVALGFPGCEDEGREREEFIKQADAVCSDAQVQIDRVVRPQDPRDLLQLALFLERAVPIARSQNRRLKALERPEEEKAEINRLIGALEAEVDAAERMLAAAKRESQPGIQAALQDSAIAGAQTEQAARNLGLRVCGGG